MVVPGDDLMREGDNLMGAAAVEAEAAEDVNLMLKLLGVSDTLSTVAAPNTTPNSLALRPLDAILKLFNDSRCCSVQTFRVFTRCRDTRDCYTRLLKPIARPFILAELGNRQN